MPKRSRGLGSDRVPPRDVRRAAAEGLALVGAGYAGRGLTQGAIDRAKRLVDGEPIGLTGEYSAQQMRGWFRRHRVDWREDWEARKTPGYVAWQLWGGDAGWAWVEQLG